MKVSARRVLVSDFDGTMTQHDFYKLAIEKLVPAGTPNFWDDYRAGTITHHEALRRYFGSIRASEAEILAVVDRMELDPQLYNSVAALRAAGWDVVVASAGCDWYIRRLLAAAGVELQVYSNPGQYENGRGLVMEMPRNSPFYSANLGVDKTEIVRSLLAEGIQVAFAGDGFPDADPARLVPEELRFARGDLATVLQREGLGFRTYKTWSEIAQNLLQRNP
jgi:2-hydroxy-3-keto-5-methylthiopentenyl-1-phosphate phosphatase